MIHALVLHFRQKLYALHKKYQQKTGNKNFFDAYTKLKPIFNHPGTLLFRRSAPDLPGKTSPVTVPYVAAPKLRSSCPDTLPMKFEQNEASSENDPRIDSVRKSAEDDGVIELLDSDEEELELQEENARRRSSSSPEDKDWWTSILGKVDDLTDIRHGGKMSLLLQILARADAIGEKGEAHTLRNCVSRTLAITTKDTSSH